MINALFVATTGACQLNPQKTIPTYINALFSILLERPSWRFPSQKIGKGHLEDSGSAKGASKKEKTDNYSFSRAISSKKRKRLYDR